MESRNDLPRHAERAASDLVHLGPSGEQLEPLQGVVDALDDTAVAGDVSRGLSLLGRKALAITSLGGHPDLDLLALDYLVVANRGEAYAVSHKRDSREIEQI